VIRSHYSPRKSQKDVDYGKSVTLPGKARSIRQLMEAMAQGMPLTTHVRPVYFDDVDIDTISSLFSPFIDLTDIEALAEQTTYLDQKVKAALAKKKAAEAVESPEGQKQEE